MRRHFTDPEHLTLLQDDLNGSNNKIVFGRHNALRLHQALGIRTPLDVLESYRPPTEQVLLAPASSLAVASNSFRKAIFDAINSRGLS